MLSFHFVVVLGLCVQLGLSVCRACLHVCPCAPCWNDDLSLCVPFPLCIFSAGCDSVLSVSLPVKPWEGDFGTTQGFVSELWRLQRGEVGKLEENSQMLIIV